MAGSDGADAGSGRRVLDASALLALLNGEAGAERVAAAVRVGSVMSAVNYSEVVAKLDEAGMPAEEIRGALEPLELDVVAFDRGQAYHAGGLRSVTRKLGLSLGDRACLALAQLDGLPALTAERSWSKVAAAGVGVEVEAIR